MPTLSIPKTNTTTSLIGGPLQQFVCGYPTRSGIFTWPVYAETEEQARMTMCVLCELAWRQYEREDELRAQEEE